MTFLKTKKLFPMTYGLMELLIFVQNFYTWWKSTCVVDAYYKACLSRPMISSAVFVLLTPLVLVMGIQTFNLKELIFTIMKPLLVDIYLVLSSWISNLQKWTPSVRDLSISFLEPKTQSSVKLVLETTVPRFITVKVLSSLTQVSTSFEKK